MSLHLKKTPIIVHLHSHMPSVIKHDAWPHGSVWLSEVVFESYIPLLKALRKLYEEGISPTLSFDLSPVLIEQLAHLDSLSIFTKYAEQQIEQSQIDRHTFKNIPEAICNIPMADYWEAFYQSGLEYVKDLQGHTLLHEYKRAQEDGLIEIMNCGLTHAYLPLLNSKYSVIQQIAYSATVYEQYFGINSSSMFLPECGYAPTMQDVNGEYTLEDILLDSSIQRIILDQQHSIQYPREYPQAMPEDLRPLQPVRLEGLSQRGTLIALIRHKSASDKVWSQQNGYPKHQAYLEFHKREFNSSLRYWKVTNHSIYPDEKYPYSVDEAQSQVKKDAREYVQYLENLALSFYEKHSRTGVLCLAFDTELFGHWWFEGPDFLSHVIREIHASEILALKVPSDIEVNNAFPIVQCASGSWGLHGNDETWNNPKTMQILTSMHQAEMMFGERKSRIDSNDSLQVRIMNQALRELLLLEASDWPFLISRQQASDYALLRFNEHFTYVTHLISLFDRVKRGDTICEDDIHLLEQIEQKDDLFQSINCMDWKNH